MNEPAKMLTNPRPLPTRKPVRWGAKVKWVPTSFRFPPDLHKFLKDDAAEEDVNLSWLVLEVLEQYRSFKTAKKRTRK